jgi:imidazolonepropionase-like amidohydrolase
VRRALLAVLAAGAVLTSIASADAPRVYAIRGARIVTVTTGTIEKGTVVIRAGMIETVEADEMVPADAVIVDGAGLTVYPGLIDLGAAGATDAVGTQPLRNARTTAQVERWKRQQLFRPQVQAADILKVDDADMTRLASAGITTVLAVPPGEVIPGYSALVDVAAPPESTATGSVAASRRSLAVVRAPVALHVSFPARPSVGSNAYPVSLMGVVAFVRQAFLDAQQYAAQAAIKRPAVEDPVLAAMQPAIQRRIPVAFEANQSRQILRALRFARELDLDPIITGAREAGLLTEDLKAAGARVIVSLDYPQRSPALAPDEDEPLRDVEARADAPKTPGDLAGGGTVRLFQQRADRRPRVPPKCREGGGAPAGGRRGRPRADDRRGGNCRGSGTTRVDRERENGQPDRHRRRSVRRAGEDRPGVRRRRAGRHRRARGDVVGSAQQRSLTRTVILSRCRLSPLLLLDSPGTRSAASGPHGAAGPSTAWIPSSMRSS